MPAPSLHPRARLLCAALVCLGLLFVSARARAQSISIVNEASLPRLDDSGNTVSKRPLNLEPEAVNVADCFANQRIRFPLQLSGFEANASLQAWASVSSDCKQQIARNPGTAQTCWNLVRGIPLQTAVTVDIPVRDIMSGISPPFSPAQPVNDASLCGRVDLTSVTVHFLYFKPGDPANAAVDKTVTIKVDTVGPAPPTGLRTKSGNTRIHVEWDNISGEGGLTALTGVKVYCVPATAVQGSVTPIDGGTELVCQTEPVDASDDSGDATVSFVDAGCSEVPVDGGAVVVQANECTSPEFTDPIAADGGESAGLVPTPDFDAKYLCGSITGNTGTSVKAEAVGGQPLENGKRYAVAVAATDAFGNVGRLSDVLCQTPLPTTDFWENYKNAGGDAGGGCSTSNAALPLGSASVLGIAVAVALSALRRSMKGKRR